MGLHARRVQLTLDLWTDAPKPALRDASRWTNLMLGKNPSWVEDGNEAKIRIQGVTFAEGSKITDALAPGSGSEGAQVEVLAKSDDGSPSSIAWDGLEFIEAYTVTLHGEELSDRILELEAELEALREASQGDAQEKKPESAEEPSKAAKGTEKKSANTKAKKKAKKG